MADLVYYRPPTALNERDLYYIGPINEQESLVTWSREKCIPLVREITFENAEELTDEGLPFLILFHHIDDHQSLSLFQHEVAKQLMHERCKFNFFLLNNFSFKIFLASINCLHADGAKFTHPLQHLGKTTADLPLLVIDSFRHMFLFPDIKQIS